MTTGRIDVHSHLLPGVDDGCDYVVESVQCAQLMADAGYTHLFCTPHVLPQFPQNTVASIVRETARLQAVLDEAGVGLRLIPGGEINLRPDTPETSVEALVSFGMLRKFVLIDLWAERLPPFFKPAIEWLMAQGVKVVLAHPERMAAVQREPELVDHFAEIGLLLQGNLQSFSDPVGAPTRRTVERFLLEGRYFLLGSDLHHLASLPMRLDGLRRAIDLAGQEMVDRLTIENPRQLLPADDALHAGP
jgi:protein-tyrosine phosphatase